jgi:hypothetical protein
MNNITANNYYNFGPNNGVNQRPARVGHLNAVINALNQGSSSSVAWGGITGTLSSQTDLQTALDGKVDENAAITGATKTKITYDAKGLVTVGADATTADIADSINKRYVTDAQLTVIGNTSGTNSGNQTLANTSDATSHTVTLSSTGGSVQLVEGSGITLTTTGTTADGIITIASTGGTPSGIAGAVQFSNGSAFSSDATNFFYDDTNDRLGLGINLPTSRLHVKGSGATSATNSLLITNSALGESYKINDAGEHYFSVNGNQRLQIINSHTTFNTQTVFQDSIELNAFNRCQISYDATNNIGRIKVNDTSTMVNLMTFSSLSAPRVGIGKNIVNADLSSVLELQSTTQGFLPPRMTTTQRNAIATPATGLVVYNTSTNSHNFYNGTAWKALAVASGVAGQVQFSDGTNLASTGNLLWDNTNNRLGINVSSVANTFDVNGNAFIGNNINSSTSARLAIKGTGSTSATINTSWQNSANSGIGNVNNAGSVSFIGDGSFGGNGSFGNPTNAARLHVKGTGATSATFSLLIQNSSNTVVVRSYDSGGFATGLNALAAGANSFATGENANASGSKAAAFAESIASGTNSFAFSGGTSSGIQSFAFGNGANASGIHSVALGWRNKAQANASLSTGSKANAYYQSTRTHAAVQNTGNLADGEAQWSESHFALKAALTTGATDFLLTGEANDTAANRLIPEGTNRVWNVKLSIVSVVSLITGTATGVTVGNIYMENQYLCFMKIGGVSSVFGTVDKANQKNSASLSTMLFNVIPNAINQALQIQVTAPTFAGGGSVTLTNSCKIEFTEVAF